MSRDLKVFKTKDSLRPPCPGRFSSARDFPAICKVPEIDFVIMPVNVLAVVAMVPMVFMVFAGVGAAHGPPLNVNDRVGSSRMEGEFTMSCARGLALPKFLL